MLERLRLQNFALFVDQSVEFDNGFNSLLGETGAGKSIIIDALSFVIGAKSDKIVIRYGENSTKVEAVFSELSQNAKNLLAEAGIEFDDSIIVSRSLSVSGKNDIRVNGNFVTLTYLKELGACLINIFGQHENMTLLNDKNHLSILDSYDEEKTSELKNQIGQLLRESHDIDEKINSLGGDQATRERDIDLLEYSINEIESSNLRIGEDEELAKNIAKNASFEKIVSAINSVISTMEMGSAFSVEGNLKQSSKLLLEIEKYDEKFGELAKRLDSARLEIEDIRETLEEERDASYFDERQLESMIEREQVIKKLKRKYGATIEDVLQYLSDAKQRKDNLLNAEYEIAKLEKQKDEIVGKLKAVCDKLTSLRKNMAEQIENKVVLELKELGMKNTTFKVQISPKAEEFSRERVNSTGFDDVKFLFSANLGQAVKSLSKTISGGEMSRFMLAVKNVLRNDEGMLVFDEVDAGISGQIAISVAQKLAKIALHNQILVISHLPQVSSMGDHFFKVTKNVVENQTISTVTKVIGDEIVKVIAGMGFGESLTGNACEYAKDLITKNGEFKKSLCE